MKAGWKLTELGQACDFYNGLWKGEVPPLINVGVVRNTNFGKDGTLDDSDIAIIGEEKKFLKRRLRYGDIILEKSGGGPKQPVGRVVFFDKAEGVWSFSNFTAAIRVRDSSEIEPRFLHAYLHFFYVSGKTERMQSNSTGIRNLDGNKYKSINIPVPPLTEQKRIVAILDKAFAGIDAAIGNTEKNIENARELFDSYLNSVFAQKGDGWVEKKLEALIEIAHG